MSNATEHSQSSGNNNRRRRSRGGKNRNNQNRQHDNRHGDNRRSHQSQRSEEFRPQGPRPPRNAPLPPKLSFFQKILKAIGLYKAPAAPARSPQPPQKSQQQQPQAKSGQQQQQGAPKSNTRNARSGEGGPKPASEKPQGSGKRERGPRGDKPRGGDGSTVESPRVYVGNLSYDVTEQDLQELFKGVGPVRSVEIVYNRSTHRSKGYGFVEMLHKDEAVRSVEVLHDQPFMGRKLIVSGAKSKGQDEREDQEEERPQAKVTLAPLPPAETVQPIAEPPAPAAVAETEPVIQTIVETVAEAPAAESAEPETKSEIA